MARRSRIRDIRIGRHNVAQTRVELTEIGPADRFRIGRPRLQAAAELDAGAGIGKDVDIRRLRTNRSNHPANYTSAFDLPVGQRRPDADDPVEDERPAKLDFIFRLNIASEGPFLRVDTQPRLVKRSEEHTTELQ